MPSSESSLNLFNTLVLPFLTLIYYHLFARLPPPPKAPLTGCTYLITGSNTGLGLALALHLARLQPACLILGVRSVKKGNAAREVIVQQTGYEGRVEVWEVDLADEASVRRFAMRAGAWMDGHEEGEGRLDGVVLNGGTFAGRWVVSTDGWETSLQVNALSTGLLALLLLPFSQRTSRLPAPHADGQQTIPHLTVTGSCIHYFARFPHQYATNVLAALNDPNFNYYSGKPFPALPTPQKNPHSAGIISDVKDTMFFRDRYSITKLLQLFIVQELAKLKSAEGVVINLVDPGTCDTGITREMGLSQFIQWLFTYVGWTPAKGALNLLYALLAPMPSGSYVAAGKIDRPSLWSQTSHGREVRQRVWREMCEVWGVNPE